MSTPVPHDDEPQANPYRTAAQGLADVVEIIMSALKPGDDDDNATIEARRVFTATMGKAFSFMVFRKMTPLSFWSVAIALGSQECKGVDMGELAERLGAGRAALSKGAKEVQRRAGLPPSAYMRSVEAVASYFETRESQTQKQNNKQPCTTN